MTLDANTTWFNFTSQSGNFSVYSFTGKEEICKPYEFAIELVSSSSNENISALLGTPACLSIADRSGERRLVHGLIKEVEQLHSANSFTHYRAVLVPRIAFLDQITDHRIFQHMTVPDIIRQVLREQGFPADTVAFNAKQKFSVREYCTMYGESYLDFISRLCEEEAVFWYHKHTADKHTVCFFDYKGGPLIAGENDLRFYPGSGQPADTAVISRLNLRHRVNSNATYYKEWNFINPKLFLGVGETEKDTSVAPVPPGMKLERYTYPHIYDLPDPGTRYAKIQLERQLALQKTIECESDVSRFLPGHVFSINSHPRQDINAEWFIIAAHHAGAQPGVLEHEAPEGRGLEYRSSVAAIPKTTRYVPQLEHPKNRIVGDQTAIVTGPEGEEIYPDQHGRVKVQFLWDREGQWNEKTTCWIRVSQGWAGSQYGTMAIPRIGHEVVVAFLSGDPDRPIITGRVYHGLNQPPYALPEHKTRTVFKSMSTPGKENEKRGFNELRIEDKTGAEEIYVHAEKDVNIHVKNDWKEHILRDRHETIDNFTYLETRGETHETLRGQRKTELFANDNLTVHGDDHLAVDGKWLAKVGDEVHIKAGAKGVIEAGAELTIKAGGQWVKLDPSGIKTSAVLRIGQGPAGNESDVAALLPIKTTTVEQGTVPKSQALALIAAAQKGRPFCPIC